jgi:hypothetical protein
MLNTIFEFLFCPQHGVLRVEAWPSLAVAFSVGVTWIRGRCKK